MIKIFKIIMTQRYRAQFLALVNIAVSIQKLLYFTAITQNCPKQPLLPSFTVFAEILP